MDGLRGSVPAGFWAHEGGGSGHFCRISPSAVVHALGGAPAMPAHGLASMATLGSESLGLPSLPALQLGLALLAPGAALQF